MLATPASVAGRGADRFVYTVKHGGQEVTVGEQALDADAKRLMQWVMSRGR